MTNIARLTDSCLLVTTDTDATMIDPGFHTFGNLDHAEIGDVTRVLITHEHGDHLSVDFLQFLIDRRRDISIHANQAVAAILAKHDFEVEHENPAGVSSEDVEHEMTPMGTAPPNRAFTLDGLLTHPGDSFQPTSTAPVLALPLLTPWASMHQSMEFARRLTPQQAIPIHDFYLSDSGREWANAVAKKVLAESNIEFIPLDWGQSMTV